MGALEKMAASVPNYPGRGALEALLRPVVAPAARKYAGHRVQRLLGFWVLWHTFGGRQGLQAAGLLSRGGLYGQRQEFAEVFGVPVEDFGPVELRRALGGDSGRA